MKNNPIVCFLPCCKTKNPSGEIIARGKSLSQAEMPNTWSWLVRGRKGMRLHISFKSPLTSAIFLYTGFLYKTLNKDAIIQTIESGHLRLIIISAGYGIVDAFEPIHDYDAEMKGKTATYWRNHKLIDIICDFLLNANPSKVFGFFTGSADWVISGSKYRYFFTEGLRHAHKRGLKTQLSGCFYRKTGKGVKNILSALGHVFMDFMNNDFNEQFAIKAQQEGIKEYNVKIGFDEIMEEKRDN